MRLSRTFLLLACAASAAARGGEGDGSVPEAAGTAEPATVVRAGDVELRHVPLALPSRRRRGVSDRDLLTGLEATLETREVLAYRRVSLAPGIYRLSIESEEKASFLVFRESDDGNEDDDEDEEGEEGEPARRKPSRRGGRAAVQGDEAPAAGDAATRAGKKARGAGGRRGDDASDREADETESGPVEEKRPRAAKAGGPGGQPGVRGPGSEDAASGSAGEAPALLRVPLRERAVEEKRKALEVELSTLSKGTKLRVTFRIGEIEASGGLRLVPVAGKEDRQGSRAARPSPPARVRE